MKQLYMAPINLKSQLLSMIEREIQRSTPETPGLIMAKMNSLGHKEIIDALYRANAAGVQILLNIRGICLLVPGVPGLSDNISVVSIIDRYLEHSRIFYFQNGGAEEIYLSSADWMPRNLLRRIELLTPIQGEEIADKLIQILQLQSSDTVLAHELQNDGSYVKIKPEGNNLIDSHKIAEMQTNKMYNSVKKQSPNYVHQLTTRLFKES
ncbi:MAG: RNA degradosome polyphosphate kinase, partial [Sulfuricurvum sp.]